LKASSFTQISAAPTGTTLFSRTIGVDPINSRTLSTTRIELFICKIPVGIDLICELSGYGFPRLPVNPTSTPQEKGSGPPPEPSPVLPALS
jgi:hypothetical protein